MAQFEIIDARKYGEDGYLVQHVKGVLPVRVAKQIEKYTGIYYSREGAEKALEEIKKIVTKAI